MRGLPSLMLRKVPFHLYHIGWIGQRDMPSLIGKKVPFHLQIGERDILSLIGGKNPFYLQICERDIPSLIGEKVPFHLQIGKREIPSWIGRKVPSPQRDRQHIASLYVVPLDKKFQLFGTLLCFHCHWKWSPFLTGLPMFSNPHLLR